MAEKMPECCETCRFWEAPVATETAGHCMRYPPIPDYTYLTNGKHENDPDAMAESGRNGFLYPLTEPGDWCGEHQPREMYTPKSGESFLTRPNIWYNST